jgi:hypothetical protein
VALSAARQVSEDRCQDSLCSGNLEIGKAGLGHKRAGGVIPSVIHVAALDPFLDRNPLYLVEKDFISPPVALRHFQLATVLKIRGDAGSAEGMIADLSLDAGDQAGAGFRFAGLRLPGSTPNLAF